jgi:hypothetical protein
MSRKVLFIVSLFFSMYLNAQTGIGTTTPEASAKLDVSSTNKGFLPPRVSLTRVTDNTTISSPATGLLVYCKGDAGLAAGYYYWNGNAWATIATAGGSGSFAASFLRGSRTATQSVAKDGIVSFSAVDNTAGQDISLNTANGKITLAPGNTYRLIAAVPTFTSGQRPSFMWYNETTTSYIGSASSTYNTGDAASYGAFGVIAHVIITPTVSTVISFRMLSSLSNGNVTIGGNADFSTTGSYPWFEAQVISGNAPVTGQSVDYVSIGSINLAGVGGNQDLIFSSNFGGNIPYNTTTGVFTLSANKTYLLQAQVRVNTASASGNYIEYGFVDAISNALLVDGTETITSSTTSTAGYGSNPVINFIYTPISNQTVKLRTTSSTRGTQSVVSGTANITQIGSSAFVSPWTLSGTNTFNTTGNVGIGTSSPSSSALLDISSTSKGILIPRMTASQKNAISSPTTGLLIFQTDAPSDFYHYNGSSWISLTEPNWTSAGTIQSVGWGATTTTPTIGAATVNDYSYKQIGAKTWKCQLTYSAGGSSTGVNIGSGDYLFTLPNGLQFNTSLAGQNAITDNVGASNWTWPGVWLSSSTGSITNLNQGGQLFVVPYSNTQFRLIHVGIAGIGYVIPYASGYYGLGGNVSWRVTFTFQSL